MTGTKTNTPLMEIPQSISAVGAEQIRDQKPANVAEALRYVPGVGPRRSALIHATTGSRFAGSTRRMWGRFSTVCTASFGFATWKIKPFGIERIDILRGPSGMLHDGSGPGGLVNIISKDATLPASQLCRDRNQFVRERLLQF